MLPYLKTDLLPPLPIAMKKSTTPTQVQFLHICSFAPMCYGLLHLHHLEFPPHTSSDQIRSSTYTLKKKTSLALTMYIPLAVIFCLMFTIFLHSQFSRQWVLGRGVLFVYLFCFLLACTTTSTFSPSSWFSTIAILEFCLQGHQLLTFC